MDIYQPFKDITEKAPYDFQLSAINALLDGASIILLAPTGSGKSEVALVSFLLSLSGHGKFPPQMVYSLPTRVLIDNLSTRTQEYVQKYAKIDTSLSVACHHGKRSESSLFNEDIILTTIDQTVGAYACTPLSAPITRGNIFAGSVSSAFLVFDEIHTYDPYRALQTAITLIEHSSKLMLPVCVMSATLPSPLVEKIEEMIKQNNNVSKIYVEDENEIASRKQREVWIHTRFETVISPEELIAIYKQTSDKKIIVVCNTVEKAQTLFRELYKSYEQRILREELCDAQIILVHSRFLDEDRKSKEEELQKIFSKESNAHAILISTQVIEVGIDISANTILTEIAPIDSLIQRAGRCARWGGKGDFYIFDTESYAPYEKDLVENTKKELANYNNEILSWKLERELVDRILSDRYKTIVSDVNRYKILGTLANAIYSGDKNLAEAIVRDAYTCNVSIHDDPASLGEEIIKLQKVNVNVNVFRWKAEKLLENNIKIWRIEENNVIGDYSNKYFPALIRNVNEILPFQNYIISSEGANYEKNVGLVIGEKGNLEFRVCDEKTPEESFREFCRKSESWLEHANACLNIFNKLFLAKYQGIIENFERIFNLSRNGLTNKIKIAIAFHDIGKLNEKWQKEVGGDWKNPLAHSDKREITTIGIPHATVSAESLKPIFIEWGKQIGIPFYLAVAHHHAPRAMNYHEYRFVNHWKEYLLQSSVLKEIGVDKDLLDKIKDKNSNGKIDVQFIDISEKQNILPYRLYAFISKILRLSDWIAVGGGRLNGNLLHL